MFVKVWKIGSKNCSKVLFTTHRNNCQSPLINYLTSDVDLDNDQVEHQYKKKEIKPRSNWNKKSASPYCESLTARMQPADFEAPKLFKYRTTSKVHLNRPNLIYLNRPHSNDTNLKQISCDHCNFKSFTMYDIENHMKSYCPRRQIFTCSDCKEDFSQKKNLTAHMQCAHGRKRLFFDFKCPECNFSSMNKSGLMNHIRMSHL